MCRNLSDSVVIGFSRLFHNINGIVKLIINPLFRWQPAVRLKIGIIKTCFLVTLTVASEAVVDTHSYSCCFVLRH